MDLQEKEERKSLATLSKKILTNKVSVDLKPLRNHRSTKSILQYKIPESICEREKMWTYTPL